MMKDLKPLFISVFGDLTGSDNSRIRNLTRQFESDNPILFISDFDHWEKEYKKEKPEKIGNVECKYLHVTPYSKNLSLKRFFSHISFAKKLKNELKILDFKPSFIYCLMPTSSAAYVAGQYAKKYNIPFIIDVIDIWPDSLIPFTRFKKLLYLAVFPWHWLSKKVYNMADYISAESREYMNVAKRHNPMAPSSYTYLGVDIDYIETLISFSQLKLNKPHDEIWICYGGSLGNSYDFNVILEGVKYIDMHGIKYKMWFVGDGEKREMIEKFSMENHLNIEITRRIDYGTFLKYLSYCDIGINSFLVTTKVAHSYKFNDYVGCGLYVLNNLKGETAELIEEYGIGKNFDQMSLNRILLNTCQNWREIEIQIKNNLKEAISNILDRENNYRRLASNINYYVKLYV